MIKIQNNNNKHNEKINTLINNINSALSELEEYIRNDLNKNTPKDNLYLPKIELPRGYIRKKIYFEKSYKLNKIFDSFQENKLIDNLAYSLQYTDFLNYLFNRFKIGEDGLSVGLIFRKTSIIYIVIIIETITIGILKKAIKECNNCEYKKCLITKKQVLFGNNRGKTFKDALDKLYDVKIINKEEHDLYKYHIDIRNQVHLFLAKENAFRENLNVKDYSKTIKLLKLTNQLYDRFQNIQCNKIKESFV
jgi:hypothetical protein